MLGSLPPPSTDEVARPLVVPGADAGSEHPTEFTEDPDTVDEPTEEVRRPDVLQVDENADRWERMLGLDLKPSEDLDKQWIRAARGESEYQRFVVWGALFIFMGVLGWKLFGQSPTETILDTPAAGPADTADIAPSPSPVPTPKPVAAPEPVPSPEPVPVPQSTTPAPAERTKPAPPPPPVRAKSRAKATPAPVPRPTQKPQAEPAPPPEPVPVPPSPSTAAFRVTGNAHTVHLVGDGRRIAGGRIPPGRYTIEVVFHPDDAPQNQGVLALEAGESAIVNCKAAFYRCTVRGPWK